MRNIHFKQLNAPTCSLIPRLGYSKKWRESCHEIKKVKCVHKNSCRIVIRHHSREEFRTPSDANRRQQTRLTLEWQDDLADRYMITHTHTHIYIYIYIYIYTTHTHTHTHIYIYIYMTSIKLAQKQRNGVHVTPKRNWPVSP